MGKLVSRRLKNNLEHQANLEYLARLENVLKRLEDQTPAAAPVVKENGLEQP